MYDMITKNSKGVLHMKRIGLLALACCVMLSLAACTEVTGLSGNQTGTVHYAYGTITFTEDLTQAEIDSLVAMLNGKVEVSVAPDCGYSQGISFTLGSQTYAVSQDGCGVLLHMNTDRYITLSAAEWATVQNLFTSREGILPCVSP